MREAWKYVFAIARRSPSPFGELERALDVLARGDVVALATVRTRAPAEDVGAQQVAREPGALGELERLVEERDRRADARELPAGDSEPEQNVRAVDIRELRVLGERAGGLEELDRAADVAELAERPRLTREPAQLERPGVRALDARARLAEGLDRLLVLVRLGQCLRPGECRLDLRPLLRGDA